MSAQLAKLALTAIATAVFSQGLASPQDRNEAHTDQANPDADRNYTHGTVNVLLANKHGLVAVADGRLVDAKRMPILWPGQKLFKIDDRTICTIAGWYSADTGHSNEGNPSQSPADLTVSSIMKTVIERASFGGLRVEEKFEILASTFRLSLMISAEIALDRHTHANPSISEITLASVDEKGGTWIYQANLNPVFQHGDVVGYELEEKPPIRIANRFVYVIRGLDDFGNSIVSGKAKTSDAILRRFQRSNRDKLRLDELIRVAEQIAIGTSDQHPLEVGDPWQVAIIQNGAVKELSKPIATPLETHWLAFGAPREMYFFENNRIDGPVSFLKASPPKVTFVENGVFRDGVQELDNFFFFKSEFRNCKLAYSGSPLSIFDKTNTVADCVLGLLPGADPDSTFVRHMRSDFPALPILDLTDPKKLSMGAQTMQPH